MNIFQLSGYVNMSLPMLYLTFVCSLLPLCALVSDFWLANIGLSRVTHADLVLGPITSQILHVWRVLRLIGRNLLISNKRGIALEVGLGSHAMALRG